MLRKLLSLGALVVVALALGAGPASAKNDNPGESNKPSAAKKADTDGFSDGRLAKGLDLDGFSDGRLSQ
jgi:hypothetical protein